MRAGGGNSEILPRTVSHLSPLTGLYNLPGWGGGTLLVMTLFSGLYEIVPNYPTISCIQTSSGDTEILIFMSIGFMVLKTVIILHVFSSDKDSLN